MQFCCEPRNPPFAIPVPVAKNKNHPTHPRTGAVDTQPPGLPPKTLPTLSPLNSCFPYRLLEGEILSREEVAAAAASLSRADCEALAEERAIAGKCGNPCCGRPHAHVPARERQRISRQHRKVRRSMLSQCGKSWRGICAFVRGGVYAGTRLLRWRIWVTLGCKGCARTR